MLFKLLLYLLGCYGITMIVVQSKIVSPVRTFVNYFSKQLAYLLSCMQCFGFWVGSITPLLLKYSITEELFLMNGAEINLFFRMLFDGAIASCVIWFIYLIQLNLEKDVKDEI